MLSRIVLAAICCARAAGATGVAAAAVGPTEFTVYGSTTSQSLWFDRNQNGQPDPGDVLSTTGPLSNGQFQIGTWQAAVEFVNSSTLSVLGVSASREERCSSPARLTPRPARRPPCRSTKGTAGCRVEPAGWPSRTWDRAITRSRSPCAAHLPITTFILPNRPVRAGGAETDSQFAAAYTVLVVLAVGDVIVYGSHGVGRVRARQKRVVRGAEVELVELELADGLTVTLPLGRAQEQLRPLASESDLQRVQETLREGHMLGADSWTKRRQTAQAKLRDGDPVGLAELVRDGARRKQARSAAGPQPALSPSEQELSLKARQLLSAEVALARGLRPAEANAWIDEQLAHAG